MKLDNGLTVIIKENHSIQVVSVQVWVKTGSINESKKTLGLSHFLEHLIFKGTDKFPGQEIAHRVETQGGVINAGTSKDFTHYYIDTHVDGFGDAVEILADAMANASFPANEIENERPVVLEEISRHYDNPSSVLYDIFSETVYRDTPYRTSIIGSADVIKNVSRDEIIGYYKANYIPSNMVLSISGDIDSGATLKLIKKTFGAQPAGITPVEPNLHEDLHKAVKARKNKDVEHAYWIGGFVGPDIESDEQFAADITATILGGGRSARLFRKLREEKKLVYSISCSYWGQRGSGAMAITAVFDPKNEEIAVREINSELKTLMENGPADTEIKRAKEMTKSQWCLSLETVHDAASNLGYWQMQGKPEIADKYIEKLDKVSKKDIVDFLHKYYGAQTLCEALITPEFKTIK